MDECPKCGGYTGRGQGGHECYPSEPDNRFAEFIFVLDEHEPPLPRELHTVQTVEEHEDNALDGIEYEIALGRQDGWTTGTMLKLLNERDALRRKYPDAVQRQRRRDLDCRERLSRGHTTRKDGQ